MYYGLLWGFPIPIILALLLTRVKSERIRKNTINNICPELYFCNCNFRDDYLLLSPIGPINQATFLGNGNKFYD